MKNNNAKNCLLFCKAFEKSANNKLHLFCFGLIFIKNLKYSPKLTSAVMYEEVYEITVFRHFSCFSFKAIYSVLEYFLLVTQTKLIYSMISQKFHFYCIEKWARKIYASSKCCQYGILLLCCLYFLFTLLLNSFSWLKLCQFSQHRRKVGTEAFDFLVEYVAGRGGSNLKCQKSIIWIKVIQK